MAKKNLCGCSLLVSVVVDSLFKNFDVANVSVGTKTNPKWKMDFKTLGPYRIFSEEIHGSNFVRKEK